MCAGVLSMQYEILNIILYKPFIRLSIGIGVGSVNTPLNNPYTRVCSILNEAIIIGKIFLTNTV